MESEMTVEYTTEAVHRQTGGQGKQWEKGTV